jgi:Zn-dependent protease
MPQNFALIIFELFIMVLAICFHDAAQAWAANRQGDPTARMLGRITMNPARHFDLWGTAIWPLLFIYFSPLVLGWGKPVPMTARNFRKKNGEMLSVLAGPAAQFLAAVVAMVVLVVLKHTVAGAGQSLDIAEMLAFRAPIPTAGLPSVFPVLLFLYMCITVNLMLCVFNLLPMPFLDGGRILAHFLPYNAAKAFEQYSFYFMIAFFFIGYRLIMIAFVPLLSVFSILLKLL